MEASLRTRPDQRGAACWITTSDVLVLQKVGPLQHLHVALIDFKCGAEADGQTGQYVAALHEQEGLPVDFLMGQRTYEDSSKWIQAKIIMSVYQARVSRNLS